MSVSGVLAAGCAALGLGGFLFVHRLAYLPAVAALGLFTLVIWLAAWAATARAVPLWGRLLAAPALAVLGTAMLWRGVEVSATVAFAVPFLFASAAALVGRRVSWAVTAVLCAGYAALFWL